MHHEFNENGRRSLRSVNVRGNQIDKDKRVSRGYEGSKAVDRYRRTASNSRVELLDSAWRDSRRQQGKRSESYSYRITYERRERVNTRNLREEQQQQNMKARHAEL